MSAVYIDYNGRIACSEHGGMYLKCALEAKPNARSIDTPLGNWIRLTKKEMQEPGMECEGCFAEEHGYEKWEHPAYQVHMDEEFFPFADKNAEVKS